MADKGAEVAQLKLCEIINACRAAQMIHKELEEARDVAVIIDERCLAHPPLAHKVGVPVADLLLCIRRGRHRPCGLVRGRRAAQGAGGRSSHWRTQRCTTWARNSSRSTA